MSGCSEGAGLFIMRWKKAAQRIRPSVKPRLVLDSFLHPSRLQLPLLIFYLSAIWWHDRPTDRPGGRHGWVGGWMEWSLFRTHRRCGGDVFALKSASFFKGKKKEDAHLDIFLVLAFIKTLIFFLQTGIEVDFKSFLELMLFIPLFCSILSALFSRIIRTVLAICNTRSLC